ncbi:MAG TPA: hypothetical protein VN023_04595 [Methylovorus sp.]|nr:hypothetical protein [Methylovorus sp.]
MNKWLAVLLCVSASAAMADDLGRLFTTPAQRAQLDAQRQNLRALPEKMPVQEIGNAMDGAPAAPISVQGYVRRSDGKPGTVWVNQQAIQEDKATGTAIVEEGKNRRVEIKLPGTGQAVRLKAGQVYMPESNRIEEYKATSKDPVQTLPERDDAPAVP